MITLFGIKLSYEAVVFFGLFIASELIGASKYKSNGVAQLIIRASSSLKPFRREDDILQKIKDLLK
jgi:hypothetical protein